MFAVFGAGEVRRSVLACVSEDPAIPGSACD